MNSEQAVSQTTPGGAHGVTTERYTRPALDPKVISFIPLNHKPEFLGILNPSTSAFRLVAKVAVELSIRILKRAQPLPALYQFFLLMIYCY